MILVYTGNGKGKTSACVGQTLRALGQGMRVFFAQFMKRDEQAGEQIMLRRLLGDAFLPGGLGFFRHEEERPPHRQAALETLAAVHAALPAQDMLVLDESLYALKAGLLERTEVEALLDRAEQEGKHVVLSGRDAPQWLCQRAHLVTSMAEIKHPWQQGIKATRGIEF